MEIIKSIIIELKANSKPISIIFPEGNNELVQQAAVKLLAVNIKPVLVFKTQTEADRYQLNPLIEKRIIEQSDLVGLANKLYSYRKHKLNRDQAQQLICQPNYFGVMQVKENLANGMVGGITYATKDIVGPALQVLKTRPGLKLVSSVFLMLKDDQAYIFTDCALNLYPDALQLAEIAKLGYEASQIFKFKNPKLAFLSYSTKGSGKGEKVELIQNAVQTLHASGWAKCPFDGELQFDSAFNDQVRAKKAPNSSLSSGPANIYVFPNLDAANIGYKIAQRLGGFAAVGPIVIGLSKPVNDLSRGASQQDIYHTAIITAYNYLLDQ